MPQQHLDRLSSLDVSFLTNESATSHMHVGGILIFEGPPPSYDDLLDHVRSRLHLVPRFRQKLAHPPVQTGRPFWVDDPSFNLEYHVRHSALPAPGSEEQLRNTAARVFSQQLDRTKPLWELWLVQGLTRKRFALVTKTHHALVDGVSGVDIATVLFDLKPVPEPAASDDEWVPSPEPSRATLVAKGVEDLLETPLRAARRLERTIAHPEATIRQASEAVEGLGEVTWNFANPAPKVPLNVEIGSHRRYIWVRSDLAKFKGVKDVLGGTVNDVVLAVVAGALRGWLRARGIRTEGLELRAQVPVSIRGGDERGQLGNRLVVMRAPLPVYIEDPVRRLEVVSRAMQGLKQSKQALGAEVISRFNDFAPPTLLAQAARINFSTRLFNLVVTNVPGPQVPLYMLGRELEDVFPVGFLPPSQALFVAIMSYNGGVNFGLLADYDSMDDVDLIAGGIEGSILELVDVAEATRAASEREPASQPAKS
ncbi:MAG TPA: wax ester/triacylglycerol synthase family O-acyltransferase [Solirubrobacterales bacterium]|nr:wax ester/triacylglycerol synthase family O-acyltransferase [Solirubrobacterales bacterium]